jgi:hypothetical protein
MAGDRRSAQPSASGTPAVQEMAYAAPMQFQAPYAISMPPFAADGQASGPVVAQSGNAAG